MIPRRKPPSGMAWSDGGLFFVEGDLQAADMRKTADAGLKFRRWVAKAVAVSGEQRHRIAIPALAVVELPDTLFIKPHQRRNPARAIKIAPLISKAQMHLNDAAADSFKIHRSYCEYC